MLQPSERWRVFGGRALFPDKIFLFAPEGLRDSLMSVRVRARCVPARHQNAPLTRAESANGYRIVR